MAEIFPIRLLLATLPEHPIASQSIAYQLTGLLVVFSALGAIYLLLEISGAFFRRAAARKAATLVVATPVVVEHPVEHPVVNNTPPDSALTQALIAATVHNLFNGRARIVAPDVIHAIIAATVHCMFQGRARVVSVEVVHADTSWAREGRRDIFSSHRIR